MSSSAPPIRWAFHSFVYTQQLRVEDSWQLLAEDARLGGFQGIEVFLDDFGTDEQTRRIGAAFAGEGIEVIGASFAAHLYDAALRAETLDHIDRLTDRLAEVGGSILGLSGSQPERMKTEEEFAQQAEVVARIVELVAPKGLEVAYHTYPQDAADDCREIRDLTNRLGPDVLRLGPTSAGSSSPACRLPSSSAGSVTASTSSICATRRTASGRKWSAVGRSTGRRW